MPVLYEQENKQAINAHWIQDKIHPIVEILLKEKWELTCYQKTKLYYSRSAMLSNINVGLDTLRFIFT